MGGRSASSGFSAEAEGARVRELSGIRAERHKILTDIADAIAAERGETGAARMSRLAAAHGLAETWAEGAQEIKRGKFTNEGFGRWEFELGDGAHPARTSARRFLKSLHDWTVRALSA